ncbi:hypothetical protein AMATHDRAFT_183813 [Amanita thiersii Skay4041]|uniref:Major facilitator superfamily (MFS) profile domain-containing protein n=1 Tax=Amanita thiersii Skay4041 TaxID=703135 RepID=A0A2A9NEH5_9AGAR|nr:hypothetical protein AMATHDRAFT_183813 [Amanita thiersii Skay4041]
MSILILIYILNYIDRNNVAAARLQGFEEDLHLQGKQFATILAVLYIGYVLMQVPSNLLLNHIGRPSLYLPLCMTIWGALSVSTGFVTSFWGALFARFLLGFVEAAFFPGALFMISKWYKRSELSTRMALLFSGSVISNAFGSLIASGILTVMDGRLGFAAWRWLFFIEGTLTILVAILAIYILPDFPETNAHWLSPAEQELARTRIADDTALAVSQQATGQKPQEASGFKLAMADWKVWWLTFGLTAMVSGLSFHTYFPTLTATMGYNATITLLLCAPPWIVSSICILLLSIHSDKRQERFWHVAFSLSVGCIGFLIAMLSMNTLSRYVSLFLMAQMHGAFVCFLAWVSESVPHPVSKRAVALAFVNCVSQLGNVIGMYIWPLSWGPTYRKSYAICVTMAVLCMFTSYVYHVKVQAETEAARRELRRG